MIKKIFNGVLGFAIPDTCVSCDAVLEGGNRFICGGCRQKLVTFDEEHPWKDEEISRGVIDDSLSLYNLLKVRLFRAAALNEI